MTIRSTGSDPALCDLAEGLRAANQRNRGRAPGTPARRAHGQLLKPCERRPPRQRIDVTRAPDNRSAGHGKRESKPHRKNRI